MVLLFYTSQEVYTNLGIVSVCAAIYTNACLSLRAVWHAACICLCRNLYERAPVTVRCLACSLHMLISQVPRTRLGLRAFRHATCVCLCRKLHERVPGFARCLAYGLHMLAPQVARTRTCDCALFCMRLACACAASYTNACLGLRTVWHTACICLWGQSQILCKYHLGCE